MLGSYASVSIVSWSMVLFLTPKEIVEYHRKKMKHDINGYERNQSIAIQCFGLPPSKLRCFIWRAQKVINIVKLHMKVSLTTGRLGG